LLLARANPLGIRSLVDLTRPGVRFANREPGAALRREIGTITGCEGAVTGLMVN
jgi:molybdate-binding protein